MYIHIYRERERKKHNEAADGLELGSRIIGQSILIILYIIIFNNKKS